VSGLLGLDLLRGSGLLLGGSDGGGSGDGGLLEDDDDDRAKGRGKDEEKRKGKKGRSASCTGARDGMKACARHWRRGKGKEQRV
jgi:hypothetical protein